MPDPAASKPGRALDVLVFGGLRAALKQPSLTLPLDGATTAAALLDRLAAAHPAVQAHRGILRVAVNGEYVQPEHPIHPGDEVALIPPVAGG